MKAFRLIMKKLHAFQKHTKGDAPTFLVLSLQISGKTVETLLELLFLCISWIRIDSTAGWSEICKKNVSFSLGTQ